MSVNKKHNTVRCLFKDFAEKQFENCPCITIPDLEQRVFNQFKDVILAEKMDEPIKRTGRKQWENELDWVKADWTRQSKTITVNNKLIWAASIGVIETYGQVVTREQLRRICHALDSVRIQIPVAAHQANQQT